MTVESEVYCYVFGPYPSDSPTASNGAGRAVAPANRPLCENEQRGRGAFTVAHSTNNWPCSMYTCVGWPSEPKWLTSPHLHPRGEVAPLHRRVAARTYRTRPLAGSHSRASNLMGGTQCWKNATEKVGKGRAILAEIGSHLSFPPMDSVSNLLSFETCVNVLEFFWVMSAKKSAKQQLLFLPLYQQQLLVANLMSPAHAWHVGMLHAFPGLHLTVSLLPSLRSSRGSDALDLPISVPHLLPL